MPASINPTCPSDDEPRVLLLPRDPDASSAALRAALEQRFGVALAVVVSDSVGRAWRNGVVGLAIGAAGLPALLDLRGRRDLEGRALQVTQVGLADEIASAAQLLMGEADEGRPAVLVRGLAWQGPPAAGCGAAARARGGPVPMSAAVRVVALSGGIGGAKLALGLYRTLPPDCLMVVCNTGDDFEHLGLSISPDLDTVLYTLAGIANPETGWGRAGETWSFMRALEQLGGETWFRLGDADLATHVERTRRLAAGESLSAISRRFLPAPGRPRPAASRCATNRCARMVRTEDGVLPFQRYFVEQRCAPKVSGFEFRGASAARPTPALREALASDEPRGGGDLPLEPVHQHRSDPRRAGHARRDRRLPRAGGRGVADHRRARGQGADRQDDGGARHADQRRARWRSTTAACSTASCSTRPMPTRRRPSMCPVSPRAP